MVTTQRILFVADARPRCASVVTSLSFPRPGSRLAHATSLSNVRRYLVRRFHSRVKRAALERGAQTASLDRCEARATSRRPVRAQVSRALSCEASSCTAAALAKIIAPRSVDSFAARACASSRVPQFCVTLARTERKLAFRHENARTPRVCRYFFQSS